MSPDTFQDQTKAINRRASGAYLTTPHSLVAMTKRSMYIDKLDPFHTAESRTHIIPGKRKFPLRLRPSSKPATGTCCR